MASGPQRMTMTPSAWARGLQRGRHVGARGAGLRVAQLDADHQALAAHGDPDGGGGRRELAQPGGRLGPQRPGALGQALVAQRVDDRARGRAAHGVAAEGRALGGLGVLGEQLRRTAHRRQREAVGDRLGEAHEVRAHPVQVGRERRAHATEPGLDLVEDQEDPVAVGARAQPLEERAAGRVAAAVPLHGLDQVAGGVGGGQLVGVEVVEPLEGARGRLAHVLAGPARRRERTEVHVRAECPPARADVRPRAGAGQRALGAAVEPAAEGDGRPPAGGVDRQAQGALDGLAARGREREGADLTGGHGRQALGQRRGGLGGEDPTGVELEVELRAGGGQDAGVAVAQVDRRDPRGAVHDATPVGRLDPDAAGPHGTQARGQGRIHGATSSQKSPGFVSSSPSSSRGG